MSNGNDIVFGIRITGDASGGEAALKQAQGAAQQAGQQFKQTELSAKQLSAALRGVPAQFTDIFSSLAAGQSPMMVLLQQGGQLKDMFGGAGPAARALGTYVAGLVSPLTLAAGAAGALAIAFLQGDAEAANYRKALAETGNSAGLSAGQLDAMAQSVAAATGHQSAAADVLVSLVRSGRVAASVMPEVGAAIVAMSAAGGASAEDLVKSFAAIGVEPVKATLKLHEAYNFLTPVVYDQIRALAEQGRHEEAAALAQRTAAQAVAERAVEVREAAGIMESAWLSVAEGAGKAWAAMKRGVAPDSLGAQVEAQRRVVAQLEAAGQQRSMLGGEVGFGGGAAALAAARERLRVLEQQAEAERQLADSRAAARRTMDAYLVTEKGVAETQQKGEAQTRTLAQALDDYRAKIEQIRAMNPASALLDPAKVAAGEAEIRKRFEAHSAGARRLATEAERAEQAYAGLMAELGGLSPSFAREWGLLSKAFEAGKMGAKGSAEAVAQLTQAQAALLARQPAMRDAERAKATEGRAAQKLSEDAAKAAEKEIEKIDGRTRSLEMEAESYGKTRAEIAQILILRAEEERKLAAAAGASEDVLAALDREIAARKKLAEAMASGEVREANDKAAKDAAAAWDKISADIAESLTDAILEGGSDGWELLARQIKATVIRATIVPVVQGGVNSMLQSFGLGPGGGGGSAGGGMPSFGGGSFNQFATSRMGGSLGFSEYNGWSGQTELTALGESAKMFTDAAPYIYAAYLGFKEGKWGQAAGTAAGQYFGGPIGAYIGGEIGKALDKALGSDGPHRGGAAFAEVGGASGQANAGNTSGWGLDWGAFRGDRSAAVDSAVADLVSGTAQSLASLATRLGGDAAGLVISGKYAADPDDARGGYRVADAGGNVLFQSSGKYADGAKGFQQFADDSQRAILAALQAAEGIDPVVAKMLGAVDPMKAAITDVTATLTRAADWIAAGKQLEDAIYQAFTPPADMLADVFEGLSTAIPDSAAAFEALTRAQDLNTEAGRAAAAQLLQVYPLWQRVTEESERAAEAAATAAEQRRAEEERAQQQQAERNAAIWERTRERTENAAKAMRGFIDEISAFRRELTSGALAGLSPEAAYRAAQANFDRVSREAQLGNHASIDKLDEVSRALLEASQAYYAGSAGYFADRDRVLGAVDATLGVAARQSGISVPRFAEGGLHAGGLRLVGERGPELEITGPARYLNAADTRAALAGNGNREVVTELRAVVRVLGDGLSTLIEQGESHDARLATLERGARLGAARPRAVA